MKNCSFLLQNTSFNLGQFSNQNHCEFKVDNQGNDITYCIVIKVLLPPLLCFQILVRYSVAHLPGIKALPDSRNKLLYSLAKYNFGSAVQKPWAGFQIKVKNILRICLGVESSVVFIKPNYWNFEAEARGLEVGAVLSWPLVHLYFSNNLSEA